MDFDSNVIPGLTVGGMIQLAQSDYVELFLFASAATTMAGDANISTYFGGFLLSRT